MAQIRSKQIADFLSTVNWGSVNSTDIANAADIKGYVDSEITALGSNANASVDSLEAALSAEIVATNGDVSSIDTRANGIEGNLSTEVVRAESVEAVLSGEINTEKGRIDAILDASSADKDSFKEIVSLINAVDTVNDDALANVISDLNSEISATNSDITSLNTRAAGIEGDLVTEENERIDGDNSLEAALSAEIVATDADFTSVNTRVSNEEDAREAADTALQASVDSIEAQLAGTSGDLDSSVDSLETALSAEISATNSDFVRVEGDLATEISDMTDYVDGEVSTLEAALSAEISATNSDFVRVEGDLATEISDMTDYVDGEVSTLEAALSAEIVATDSDVTRIDGDVSSVETRLSIEENRVDAILEASTADKDSFKEIVDLINSVDTENDNAFATRELEVNASIDSLEIALSNEIVATNSDVQGLEDADAALQASVDSIEAQLAGTSGDLDASVDSLEVALSAEIVATNGDVAGINASVDSLEIALSAEIVATNGDVDGINASVDSLETRISDVEANISDSFVSEDDFATETFTGNGYVYTLSGTPANGFGAFDVFVNGLKVGASFASGDVTISASYTIDSSDSVVVKYVQE